MLDCGCLTLDISKANALLNYEANRNSGNENGNGNGNGNDNGNGSHDSGSGNRRTLHTSRGCTYKEFLNCQPLNFKGTKGAVGLTHWFEKMEYMFHISNCDVECQVKSEIKKLETELWNLKVKGTDVESYTQRFQELVLLCSRMVPDESDKVERYVGGLPDNIQGNVMASKQKMLQEAIKLARSLMDQKVRAYAVRQADNKRRMDNNPGDNHAQQPPYKRHNLARSYTTGPSEKKEYVGTLLLCNNSECPRLKNQNCGNQTGNGEACGRVYALGGGEADQDPDNIADDIEP
ncbi:reverse transcriptase domain-containing protein [Tanacetum coccineum]